jgi:hypothetical protein
MAYSKRYAGGFVDKPTLTTPIDSLFLNAVESALLKLLSADGTVDGQVLQWINSQTKFGPALILNKNVDPAAAIAKSKLDFSGANGIVDGDIATAAAIARSKLNFGAGLVNADISAAAALAIAKLAGYPTDGTKVLRGDGTWASSARLLDSASSASSNAGWGAEANLLVGNSVVYDGRPISIHFEAAQVIPNGNQGIIRIYEDATVLEAVCQYVATTNNAPGWPLAGTVDRTPAAGAHTYKATAVATAGSAAAVYTNVKLRVRAERF